ncbi:DUF4231 domain-containing protein [Mycoplasmopsis cricetuli]|uniref:DUF4231 domain-containing protein n=1 Tax=Mycoplasmopsis cricetuli TaxID=171283 RepID=UPI00047004F3|nr:DUF4231 domain-containing protein [Mycoplasmopsis cricetuli]
MLNGIEFYKKAKRDNLIKLVLSGFSYYFLNILSIAIALFLGVIAAIFLASTNKNYPEGFDNPYKLLFPNLTDGRTYVILTNAISAITSLISGLLSFFVVNEFYKKQKSIREKLKLEYLVYSDQVFHYKDLSENEANYLFYKRVFFILKKEKYDRENLTLKGENNE